MIYLFYVISIKRLLYVFYINNEINIYNIIFNNIAKIIINNNIFNITINIVINIIII